MMVIGEAARAARRRIEVPIQAGTRRAGKTDWLETGKDAALSPDVFLVDRPPASVLDVHFHRENQFAEVILLQLPLKADVYVGHGWSRAQKDGDDL